VAAYANSTAVVNAALQFIASQVQITGFPPTDNSAAAKAANVLYIPTVQVLLREIDPDFARFSAPLALVSPTITIGPWAYCYTYPADCLRLRQVAPPQTGAGSLADPNDPQPIRANVAFSSLSSTGRVILTNQQDAVANYTSSSVTESSWDSVFADAVVRRLANPLSMALAGRPDYAKTILEQSAMMAQTAGAVDEGGFRRFG
jgi:hypothetical protein